jgi:putative membrane protein
LTDPPGTFLLVPLAAAAGAALSGILSCLPGFHVYNLMAVFVIVGTAGVPPEALVPAAAGMVVGFAVLSAIPSVLLAAPDESAVFTVLPGQKYLMEGRGAEAVAITAAGGLAGLGALLALSALLPVVVPVALRVLSPYLHAVVWCVIAFMLLSEWPKADAYWASPTQRLRAAWRGLGAGLLTFVLSGLLGIVLMRKSPISIDSAFQSLMPAFAGLFTIPWLLMNLWTRQVAPMQRMPGCMDVSGFAVFTGGLAGVLGGGFAAFAPGVTGGVGGMLAGHATAIRDSRAFLVSQGASRMVYMAGGFLLFFLPDGGMTRGGAAWMMRVVHRPAGVSDYCLALAGMAFGGLVVCLLLRPLTRAVLLLMGWCGFRGMSWMALAIVVVFVVSVTGMAGLSVMMIGSCIGLIPVLYGSRRMNALGVVLLPLACNLSGIGPTVSGWLGLK